MDCVRVVVAAKILPSALTSDSRKDLVDPDPYRPR